MLEITFFPFSLYISNRVVLDMSVKLRHGIPGCLEMTISSLTLGP